MYSPWLWQATAPPDPERWRVRPALAADGGRTGADIPGEPPGPHVPHRSPAEGAHRLVPGTRGGRL